MPDNLSLREQDSKLISMHEPYEVERWCQRFGCTKAALAAAVAIKGHSAKAVREFFEEYPHLKHR